MTSETKSVQSGESKPMRLVNRITEYLCNGGFFNPEYMDHAAVRDLLIDCRSALQSAPPCPQNPRDCSEGENVGLTERERWLMIEAFQEGYGRGHNDTVESCYNSACEYEDDGANDWLDDYAAVGATVAEVLAKEAPSVNTSIDGKAPSVNEDVDGEGEGR